MSVPAKGRVSLSRGPEDLVQMLSRWARERPDHPAFIFLRNGEGGGGDEERLTFAELDRRARAIARHLRRRGLEGRRLLLAFPPGLDFIAGLFGCLYADGIAIPTYPPHRHRMLRRFEAVTLDARPEAVLSVGASLERYRAVLDAERRGHDAAGSADTPASCTRGGSDDSHHSEDRSDSDGSGGVLGCEAAHDAGSRIWIDIDHAGADGDADPDADAVTASGWSERPSRADATAMLQYTSGSTSRPKGVMLSHANLLGHVRTLYQRFEGHRDTVAVFWLPPYHDMGLIAGVLLPVFAGGTSVLMSPARFLQDPRGWLSAIGRYRASVSGAPDFAYELCVRRIDPGRRAGLDLSNWSVAFSGAEPVRGRTLESFARAFAPCGFRPEAFLPCYGLAEATLMVAGGERGRGATVRVFDDAALQTGRAVAVSEHDPRGRPLVACGTPLHERGVRIVDPGRRVSLPEGALGEIWVRGPSVGLGYWRRRELTRRTFRARLRDSGEGPFLRTGDLGFFSEGRLYVAGRLKDLLIVRGMNHHPQDLEATARLSHPLLEEGDGAAFSIGNDGDQRVVLVHEVERRPGGDLDAVAHAIRQSVLRQHEVALDTVMLVRLGTLPKTSSGKIQRHACREAFVADTLRCLARIDQPKQPQPAPTLRVSAGEGEGEGGGELGELGEALELVLREARAMTGATATALTARTPIADLELDSLQRVELIATVERSFGGHLPDPVLLKVQTLGDLAAAVQRQRVDRSRSPSEGGRVPEHFELTRFPEYLALKRQLALLRAAAGQSPYFRVDQGGSPGRVRIDGRELVSFCGYDYLGLARQPEVADAAKRAIDVYGTSAGASRLVSGEKQLHRDLERSLARFLGTADALAFVSGHATNVTLIGHLLGPGDLVLHDALAHNSIIQGAELSGATRRSFAHNDWQDVDALLGRERAAHRRVLIAIEGVYSMDGDTPDLPRFVEVKKKHAAMLLVDEAHSLGTLGPTGRGIAEHGGVPRGDVEFWMGTLSKTLAGCGGYIAGSAELIEYLKHTAPGFVYSVGLSPPIAAAALAALNLLQREPSRVTRLRELADLFLRLARERGLDTGSAHGSPVIPLMVGGSVRSLLLARALFDRGINVQPILYPAVPDRSARLRFFITLAHDESCIRRAVDATAEELARL